MDPVTIISLANIVLPQLFGFIGQLRQDNPEKSYAEILRESGLKLSEEEARLLQEMEQALRDGAVAR